MLLLKVLLTPLLIAVATAVERRWGPAWGGVIVGLPLTAGPVTLFLALEHGESFAARSSQGTLLGIVSLCCFCVVYAHAARRWGWKASFLAGVTAFLAATAVLGTVPLVTVHPISLAFLGTTAALFVAPRAEGRRPRSRGPSWDAPARMVVATGMVLALTGLSRALGPLLTGLLAPFPVFAGVMTAFVHRVHGAPAAITVIRGVLVGTFAYVLFFAVLAVSLESLGTGRSFLAATGAGVTMSAIVSRVVRISASPASII